uniref:Uncharacterized protein n=1 Tax=Rhizophora mucronata TaxID=61149 RepID=A0A2P2PEI1_RHIMU
MCHKCGHSHQSGQIHSHVKSDPLYLQARIMSLVLEEES